ncbi:DUF1651 domain-containing protein [Parasynechococcus sp.]|jgi:hypothetical protein|uniref:DUF1651 domain-containing protein n=1 Tax=Parasynechococcus sp. TaxID=3101203 RepID=UPI00370459FD
MDGWLIDQDRFWCVRFHPDEKAWQQAPKVFVDYGRPMPEGQPALLKSRRHLHRADAEALWKALMGSGWTSTVPLWGVDVEP